jgi:hypothetical protein
MIDLTLCNLALARCGSEEIASLTEENKRAKAVVNQYETTFLELINDTTWGFATKRVEISESGLEPEYEFIAKYELPLDHVRVIGLENDIPFRREGNYILCDAKETIKLKYIWKNMDASTWSASFRKTFVLKLAEDISYILVQSASLQEKIAAEADKYLRRARSYNAQEVGSPESRYPDGYIAGARR